MQRTEQKTPEILPGGWQIERTLVRRDDWLHVPADSPLPFHQYWAYGMALSGAGAEVEAWRVSRDGAKAALMIVTKRRFSGLMTVDTVLRGPIWLTPLSLADKASLLATLKVPYNPWRWRFLAQQPDLEASPEAFTALKQAGLRRIASGYSTAWLDLSADEADLRASLLRNWRNHLRGAEKAPISLSIAGRKPHHYSWLLEKEADQRKTRDYQATPLGIIPLYAEAMANADKQGVMSVIASNGPTKISGALFLLHGNSATYHVGWIGDEARACHAQSRVLFEAMLALKKQGVRFLDLGGLNTANLKGISRFKLGTGAKPVTMVGTYI